MADESKGISTEIKGIGELRRKLSNIEQKTEDLTDVHRRIAIRLLTLVQRGFDEGQQPGGEKWVPLKASTIFGRRGKTSNPLQDTGEILKDSFTIEGTDETQAVVGSAEKIALFHQKGTKGPYKIPKGGAQTGITLAFPWPPGYKGLKGTEVKRRKGQLKKGATLTKSGNISSRLLNLLFRKSVKHPGLPARPMLPTEELAESEAIDVADKYYADLIKRENA